MFICHRVKILICELIFELIVRWAFLMYIYLTDKHFFYKNLWKNSELNGGSLIRLNEIQRKSRLCLMGVAELAETKQMAKSFMTFN